MTSGKATSEELAVRRLPPCGVVSRNLIVADKAPNRHLLGELPKIFSSHLRPGAR